VDETLTSLESADLPHIGNKIMKNLLLEKKTDEALLQTSAIAIVCIFGKKKH
jgi:hypothetical protein